MKILPKLKNQKHEIFCKEYLTDLNATQSAIRSGYSKKTAGSIGQRLLKNVEIQKRIKELMEDRSKRTEITADKVLEELGVVAFDRNIRCIGRDKVKALELLGYHIGMFTEKVSVTTEDKLPELLEALKSDTD